MPLKRPKTTNVAAATVKPTANSPRETRARRGSSPVEIVDPEEIARTIRASKRKARTEVGQEGNGEGGQDTISQTVEQQEQHDLRDDSVEPDRHTFDMKAVCLERIAAGLESLVDLACLVRSFRERRENATDTDILSGITDRCNGDHFPGQSRGKGALPWGRHGSHSR